MAKKKNLKKAVPHVCPELPVHNITNNYEAMMKIGGHVEDTEIIKKIVDIQARIVDLFTPRSITVSGCTFINGEIKKD
jgi:hypothetical protein